MAVIQDAQGRILLSRRADLSHQGGLWEFPGGKVDPGETLEQALRREAREELGIHVRSQAPVIRIHHVYPDRAVLLDVHHITRYSGLPKGLEGQPLVWVSPDSMADYPMPDADRPIVTALRLPDCYLITGSGFNDEKSFLHRFRERLAEGASLVQFRAPGMERETFHGLARKLVAISRQESARLLLNTTPELAADCGADGVHLTSRRLMSLQRRPLPAEQWVAASCHDAAELQHAQRIGVDFAVLSPVFATASHPHASTMGWQRFKALVDQVNIPVYALGGMLPSMIGQARDCGGQGIAAIRGLWR